MYSVRRGIRSEVHVREVKMGAYDTVFIVDFLCYKENVSKSLIYIVYMRFYYFTIL